VTDSLPIAVDAMGGDFAPDEVVTGAVAASRAGIPVILVGDRERLEPALPRRSRVSVHHAPDDIAMGDRPSSIRKRDGVSVRQACRLVKEGNASAAVSFGNSGALLFGAILELGVMRDVERPAIATVFPRRDGGKLVMLDAGANVDCRPEMLACFAHLGVAYAKTLGMSSPRVGLLSNGAEEEKGNMLVRSTLPLLKEQPYDLIGYVEPGDAMGGSCDVLVCDGFMGNILLKAAEGAADTVLHLLKEEIRRRPSALFGAMLLSGAFDRFRRRVASDAHGGALLLGVDGVVVAGHGGAKAEAVQAAIERAWDAAQAGVVGRVSEQLHRE
jgi:phosphate acyltransferase